MSQVIETNLDLTALPVSKFVIAQQVNCQNRMGAGLALALMRKWPTVARKYHEFCNSNLRHGGQPRNLLGRAQGVCVGPEQYVCNLFGQEHYGHSGHYTNETALLHGIELVLRSADNHNLPVYIPANIGSGLAGGDRSVIQSGIRKIAQHHDTNIYLVNYQRN